MLKDITFCLFPENLEINTKKKIVDTTTKTEIDAEKSVSKRVVQKMQKQLDI